MTRLRANVLAMVNATATHLFVTGLLCPATPPPAIPASAVLATEVLSVLHPVLSLPGSTPTREHRLVRKIILPHISLLSLPLTGDVLPQGPPNAHSCQRDRCCKNDYEDESGGVLHCKFLR